MEVGHQEVGLTPTPILLRQIQVAAAVVEAGIKVLAQMVVLELSLFAGLNHNNHQLPQQEALR
jgi:hypothetical protein